MYRPVRDYKRNGKKPWVSFLYIVRPSPSQTRRLWVSVRLMVQLQKRQGGPQDFESKDAVRNHMSAEKTDEGRVKQLEDRVKAMEVRLIL